MTETENSEPGTRFHAYRGHPCIPGTDPRECPGCHPGQQSSADGDVRLNDDERLEVFDGTLWIPLTRLPGA